nr:MAG TPA: orexin-A [Caudoviricetes sp.]
MLRDKRCSSLCRLYVLLVLYYYQQPFLSL